MSRLEEGLRLAVAAHHGQFRKDNLTPYIVHPIEVMKRVRDWGVTDEDILVAAVLHDCVEETSVTLADIESRFGCVVRCLVDELTFDGGWGTKQQYLESFCHKSIRAYVIKAADRLCNVRDFLNAGNPQYAAKYFAKAAVLVEIVESRQAELDTVHPMLAGRIKTEFEELQACLALAT